MKLPSMKFMVTVAVCGAMLVCGAAMLGVGIYKMKHHPTGPPGGMPHMPTGGSMYGTTPGGMTGEHPGNGTSTPTSGQTSTATSSAAGQASTTTSSAAGLCDLYTKPTAAVFLIDLAHTPGSSLDTKLSSVRTFLSSIPPRLNLKGSWGNSTLGIAIYYGNEAYLLNNQLCSTDSCWTQTVNNLTGDLNVHKIAVHNATRGVQFVDEEFGKVYGQLAYGVARSLLIIGDGYEFTGWAQASDYASRLRNNYFSVSSIAATRSTAVENAFRACADNSYNFFKLNDINDISSNALSLLVKDWICRAYTVTTRGATTLPTQPVIPVSTEGPVSPGQLAPRIQPCSQFTDLVIIYHSSASGNWTAMTNFIGDELLPTLLGDTTTSSVSPYNIALLAYTDSIVTEVATFKDYHNASEYSSAVKSMQFVPPVGSEQLSEAYVRAGRIFKESRFFASNVIAVFTDYIEPSNAESATEIYRRLPTSYVLGVEIETGDQTLTIPSTELLKITRYTDIDGSNQISRRNFGNQIAKKVCTFVYPNTTQAPTTTTTAPPTRLPPPVEPREVWPDIAILIDTSSTIGSREFETIREFLQRTLLEQYSITPRNTRVSIALFNEKTIVKTVFQKVTSYSDLELALGENLERGEMPLSPVRNLTGALSTLLTSVYVETESDYNPFKENFLWIFLSGSPSDNNYVKPLRSLQRMGVRTEAIGLGTEINNEHLSQFGYTSFQVSNWSDDLDGINSNTDDLAAQIFEDTTSRRTQPLSKIDADFYFVIDQSNGVNATEFSEIRDFLISFTSRLSIDALHCGVSIAPFSDDINGGLQLTYDNTALTNYLNGLLYFNTNNVGSNIGKAAQTLKQSYLKGNDVSTHIIFIVGSKTSTGAEQVSGALANAGNIFALGLNSNITYLNTIADADYRYSLSLASDLRDWVEDVRQKTIWNPMTHFFLQLAAVQEIYMQSHAIPLKELNADFVFAIDLTLVSNETFPIIKNYILDFGRQLNIDPNGAQIAAHSYTFRNVPEDGFHFSQVNNFADLEQQVNALKLRTNDVSSGSDIAGAFIDIADFILTSKNRWREGPTYIIALSTAARLLDHENDTAEATRKIFSKAKALGLNMDGRNDENAGFLRLFTPDYYAVVPKIEDLAIGANFSTALFDKIDRLYKTYNFPDAPEFLSLVADFVFIIDHSSKLTATGFEQIKTLMLEIMKKGTFLPKNSRLGVLSYDSYGLRLDNSININRFLDRNGTMMNATADAISKLHYANDPFSSNLTSVMDYIVNNGSSFGLRINVPVIITLFAASPQIADYIPPSLTTAFGARRMTYVFENADLPYVKSFLGPNRAANAQITNVFQLNDNYLGFISSGYQKWMTTFAG